MKRRYRYVGPLKGSTFFFLSGSLADRLSAPQHHRSLVFTVSCTAPKKVIGHKHDIVYKERICFRKRSRVGVDSDGLWFLLCLAGFVHCSVVITLYSTVSKSVTGQMSWYILVVDLGTCWFLGLLVYDSVIVYFADLAPCVSQALCAALLFPLFTVLCIFEFNYFL